MRTPRLPAALPFLAVLVVAAPAPAGERDAAVARALELAGANRPELERVLDHYRGLGDPQKLAAAEHLVANMEGHGYAELGFLTEDDEPVPFDALAYPRFREAQAAMDALEQEHGPIHYGRLRFVPDLEAITADFLIDDIDRAFEAWRTRPWAQRITFDAFLEHVLPYRGSNEPLQPWRADCIERLADVVASLEDPSDPVLVAGRLRDAASRWVRFRELFYLHPTDQGYAEMLETGAGRCEDISNMIGYALRAHACLVAADYTPAWANRDNNHAWEVLLDADGRGRAGLSNRAAKVYRKTFARQPDSLGALRTEDEDAPRWLRGANYVDVTDQYMDTTDVVVTLDAAATDRWAYLCVFNGGSWTPIHWGAVDGATVTFTDMGRNIAYLPALQHDGEPVGAAAPFILDGEGAVRRLGGEAGTVAITFATKDAAAGDDAPGPRIEIPAGVDHELFQWDGDWVSVATVRLDDAPMVVNGIPAGRLYWFVRNDGRRLERIFTIEDGVLRRW